MTTMRDYRWFVYGFKADRLLTFYAITNNLSGQLAGQIKFYREHGWKMFYRKSK